MSLKQEAITNLEIYFSMHTFSKYFRVKKHYTRNCINTIVVLAFSLFVQTLNIFLAIFLLNS